MGFKHKTIPPFISGTKEPVSQDPDWIRRLTLLEYAITSPFPLQRTPTFSQDSGGPLSTAASWSLTRDSMAPPSSRYNSAHEKLLQLKASLQSLLPANELNKLMGEATEGRLVTPGAITEKDVASPQMVLARHSQNQCSLDQKVSRWQVST